jgi:hypothetical protein
MTNLLLTQQINAFEGNNSFFKRLTEGMGGR